MSSLAYHFRGSKLGQKLHQLRVARAHRLLDRVERDLVEAVREIDRHAIVSNQAASLYRAYEAWAVKRNRS